MGWHHMQVTCISLQKDNHASTSSLVFYGLGALPATQPMPSKHWRQIFHNYVIVRQKDGTDRHYHAAATDFLSLSVMDTASVIKNEIVMLYITHLLYIILSLSIQSQLSGKDFDFANLLHFNAYISQKCQTTKTHHVKLKAATKIDIITNLFEFFGDSFSIGWSEMSQQQCHKFTTKFWLFWTAGSRVSNRWHWWGCITVPIFYWENYTTVICHTIMY